MRILIVDNNLNWKSWPDKKKLLQDWFSSLVNINFEILYTNHKNIPFVPYNNDPTSWGVDPEWYDKHITPYGLGFDMVMLVLDSSQWKVPNTKAGWRSDYDQGPVQLQVSCNENEYLKWPNFPYMSTFFQIARHEIMHGMFMLSGQPDTTHYWWDKGMLEKARDSVKLPENYSIPGLIRSLNYLSKLTNDLMSQLKKINKLDQFVQGIKVHEGWFPPAEYPPNGSRSYRNNNPGNLKYTSYTASLGAIDRDASNFARFATPDAGLAALRLFVIDAGNNRLRAYKNCSIRTFFRVYAPSSDNNDPDRYAKIVSIKVNMPVDTPIKNII